VNRADKRRPLRYEIADRLRKIITQQYKPGDRLQTESQLAQRFAVSVMTIREALSALTQEGMVVRRHGSGTYVAEPNRDRLIAVLVEMDLSSTDTSFFYLRYVQSLLACFRRAGHRVRLYTGHTRPSDPVPDELTCPDFLVDVGRQRIMGVAAVATPVMASWTTPLARAGIPWVAGQEREASGVVLDYQSGVEQVVAKMLAAGHDHLAFIGAGGGLAANGFRKWITTQNIVTYPEWLQTDARPFIEGAGLRAFHMLWNAREHKPNGLVIFDDAFFADVAMAVMNQQISIPDQLMIATHVNKGHAPTPPFPVLRMEFDPDQVARTHVRMLLDAIDGRPHPDHSYMEPAVYEYAPTPMNV